MNLHVSMKNIKLGKIVSVSLSPIIGCPSGVPCHKKCYAMKAYRLRPVVRTAWNDNLEYAQSDMGNFFLDINKFLKDRRKPVKFFRWHVAGDILNQEYLNNMRLLAEINSGTKFLAFTKRHDLDFTGGTPANLVIVASMWPNWGDRSILPADMPCAWVQDGTETRIPSGALECSGSCDSCGLCWHLPELKRDVFFYEH